MAEPGTSRLSPAFRAFLEETPAHARARMAAAQGLGEASVLDEKTAALAYVAVLGGAS